MEVSQEQYNQYLEDRRTGRTSMTLRAYMRTAGRAEAQQQHDRSQRTRAQVAGWRASQAAAAGGGQGGPRPDGPPVGPANDVKPKPTTGGIKPPPGPDGGPSPVIGGGKPVVAPDGPPVGGTVRPPGSVDPGAKTSPLTKPSIRPAGGATDPTEPTAPGNKSATAAPAGKPSGSADSPRWQQVLRQQKPAKGAKMAASDSPAGSAGIDPPAGTAAAPSASAAQAPGPAPAGGPVGSPTGDDAGTARTQAAQARANDWTNRMAQLERAALAGEVPYESYVAENQRYEAFMGAMEAGDLAGAMAMENPYDQPAGGAAAARRPLAEINAERARAGLRPVTQEVYDALPERGAQRAATQYNNALGGGGMMLSNEYAGESALRSAPRMSEIVAASGGNPAEISRRLATMGSTNVIDDMSGMSQQQLGALRFGGAYAQWAAQNPGAQLAQPPAATGNPATGPAAGGNATNPAPVPPAAPGIKPAPAGGAKPPGGAGIKPTPNALTNLTGGAGMSGGDSLMGGGDPGPAMTGGGMWGGGNGDPYTGGAATPGIKPAPAGGAKPPGGAGIKPTPNALTNTSGAYFGQGVNPQVGEGAPGGYSGQGSSSAGGPPSATAQSASAAGSSAQSIQAKIGQSRSNAAAKIVANRQMGMG